MSTPGRRQPCEACDRWVDNDRIIRHIEEHLRENPHTFCRTIRCDNGDDCPVASGTTADKGY